MIRSNRAVSPAAKRDVRQIVTAPKGKLVSTKEPRFVITPKSLPCTSVLTTPRVAMSVETCAESSSPVQIWLSALCSRRCLAELSAVPVLQAITAMPRSLVGKVSAFYFQSFPIEREFSYW